MTEKITPIQWANTFFFFFFSIHAFFLDFTGSIFFFFSFAARLIFLFSFLHAFFFSSLGVGLFFFFFLSFFLGTLCRQLCFFFLLFFFPGKPHFVFTVFGFFCFSFFWGPCVFSLSFYRLNKQFEIDSMFLAVSLIVSLIHVDTVRNHAMNDMLRPSAPNKSMLHSHDEYMKRT